MASPSTTTDLAGFQGWWWGNSTSSATEILCPSPQTVYSSSTFLDCVSASVTILPTTCESGVLQYSEDSNITCVSPASCYTMTIAETDPPTSPTKRYMCARSDWTYSTIYRDYFIPTSVLATISSIATQSTTFSTIPSITATSTSTLADSSENSKSHQSSSSLSGGAIAGIVIGCLAGGAILAALFFLRKRLLAFFGKKRQDYDPAPQQSPCVGAGQVHEIGTSGIGIISHEMGSKDEEIQPKKVHEIHEMDSKPAQESKPEAKAPEVSDK